MGVSPEVTTVVPFIFPIVYQPGVFKRGAAPLLKSSPSLIKGFASKPPIFNGFWGNWLFCLKSLKSRRYS